MLDQLSPVAPARVRVVLLPIGQIKRARFLSFVDRLRPENVVLLGDISPDGRPNRNMFSPLAFPTGKIVYDLTTFYPPASHIALSPFELYREPLVIIALADGVELDHVSYRGNVRRSFNGNANGPPKPEHNLRELYQDLEDLRDRYPKALVHQLMLFDYVHKSTDAIPEGLVVVPLPEDCKRTTMKTIMCDISSMLLAEMTTLAKSLQALNTIESPTQTPGSRQNTGPAWQTGLNEDYSRRNSQLVLPSHDSRSGSPAGEADRSHVRMSMPAQLRRADSNASSPVGRSTSPASGLQTTPTTFDDIVGVPSGDPKPPQRTVSQRLATSESTRDSSQDRVSVQGFGSNSVSERSRNRGKGRIAMVIGSLYLQAGRWGDALKELVEAANIAKNNLDHLWHAKALDNILVSMLMLAWAGLDFEIPQICYVSAEKVAFSPLSSGDGKSPSANRLVSIQNLTGLVPELLDRMLNLYTRATNNTGEPLPQFPFSESVLRFSRLLSSIHLAGGVIDDDVLQFIVLGVPVSRVPNLITPRLNIRPTRTEIANTVVRAFPILAASDSLQLVDRIIIFSGIASVLGSIGYIRKKAMVIRELVSILIPGLVQARIKGAAEMGVHPAAGLAALGSRKSNTNGARTLDLGDGDVENGVDTFLGLLSQTYGVVTTEHSSAEDDTLRDSDEAVTTRIVQTAMIRSFGGQNLKMDVLRSCINLSEALPDFRGVLRFTADLLRTAGSGIAPGPRSEDASPSMSREEQVRLATTISRTIGAARNLGVTDITAEYWDEFLVRGVELEALPPAKTPIPHRRSEIPGTTAVATSREVNPFIYNPFLRAPDDSATKHLLVAGETAVFKVTLQNPYEFDIEIESIRLETDGISFDSATQKTVIGPYRTQLLGVSGVPKASGQLKIIGCIIRVRGCRERRFPIFQEPWSPQPTTKIKEIGIAGLLKSKERPVSVGSGPPVTSPAMKLPLATSLSLSVIDSQPVVVVKSTSLSQSAVMVLEGERQVFTLTLQNVSSIPVDLLLFSFKDSTQTPLQTLMSNRDASPAELYECELILAQKQALRWRQKDGESPYISPNSTASFDIEILGRPGLTSAFVQMDYAHVGTPSEGLSDDFHTRQVTLPLMVTVNASIELAKMDLLPLSGPVPTSLWAKNNFQNISFTPEDYCLLVLDLRNAWPSPLHVNFEISEGNSIDEEILPGNTSKLMFPVRRIFLEDSLATIPTLDPSRQRQFIVSAGKISAETEKASREAFWYREEVLKMLHGTWQTKSGQDRNGEIELRGIRLSQRMIEAVKVDDIGVEISINNTNSNDAQQGIFTDSFSEIKVRVTNRSADPLSPLLRLQPALRNQPYSISLDISRKLVWNGTLQQALPRLGSKESRDIIIGVTPLCRGEFEISASVEEARLQISPGEGIKEIVQGRPRANTRSMMDAVLGAKQRRIWHSREPCLLVVRDAESDDEG